jgi:hypothetical protein
MMSRSSPVIFEGDANDPQPNVLLLLTKPSRPAPVSSTGSRELMGCDLLLIVIEHLAV